MKNHPYSFRYSGGLHHELPKCGHAHKDTPVSHP